MECIAFSWKFQVCWKGKNNIYAWKCFFFSKEEVRKYMGHTQLLRAIPSSILKSDPWPGLENIGSAIELGLEKFKTNALILALSTKLENIFYRSFHIIEIS